MVAEISSHGILSIHGSDRGAGFYVLCESCFIVDVSHTIKIRMETQTNTCSYILFKQNVPRFPAS